VADHRLDRRTGRDVNPEYELRCEVCGGYFEADEETSLCPQCEFADKKTSRDDPPLCASG
jgi:rubrerythrin